MGKFGGHTHNLSALLTLTKAIDTSGRFLRFSQTQPKSKQAPVDELLLKPETPFFVHLQVLSQKLVASRLGQNILFCKQITTTCIVLVSVMRCGLTYVLSCRARSASGML
jgi:hypothetical protein